MDEAPIEVQTSTSGNQISLTVTNHSGIPAEGYVEIIAPVGYWPENEVLPATTLSPHRRALHVDPFSEQRIVLTTSGELPKAWMVAKVAANGYVVYKSLQNK